MLREFMGCDISPKKDPEQKSKLFQFIIFFLIIFFLRVLWTIIVLTSLAGFIYMMYEILQKYFNSPVVVSFATEDTPIYQIPFPTVTICPEHKYATSKYNYSELALNLITFGNIFEKQELVNNSKH